MVKATSIIELNGHRYDAKTGTMIDGVAVQPQKSTNIDGIRKQPSVARGTATSKNVHKSLQPSHTLMRKAVKKPSIITTRSTVAMDVVSPKPNQMSDNVFHTADPSRIKRAISVPKLNGISRFGTVGTTAHAAQPPRVNDMRPMNPQSSKATQPNVIAANLSTITPVNKTNALLDRGLRAATSHTPAAKVKKARLHHKIGKKIGLSPKTASLSAVAVFAVLISGVLLYQNIPSLSVKYASAKAGVRASLPGYQPAGFAVKKDIRYSPGELSINYQANADTRAYTITQKNTSWNSEALKDHLAATSGKSPETYPDNGQTIYLHDGSQADWVSNGVWYSITGDSSLNTDQLIKIATSL